MLTDLEKLKQQMIVARKHEHDASRKRQLTHWLKMLDSGIMEAEEQIAAAEMVGLRFPEFDDDYVGRPADDFEQEEI